jgi:hypothetical protein
LGAGQLPDINEDIVDDKTKFDIVFDGENEIYNSVLKPGLQEQKDYIFCNPWMWEVFEPYSGHAIKRNVKETIDGKKVELYFKQVMSFNYSAPTLSSLQRLSERCGKGKSAEVYPGQPSGFPLCQDRGNSIKHQSKVEGKSDG